MSVGQDTSDIKPGLQRATRLTWVRNVTLSSIVAAIMVTLLAVTSSMGMLLIAHNSFDYPFMMPTHLGMPIWFWWLVWAGAGAGSVLAILLFFRTADDIVDVVLQRRFTKGRLLHDFSVVGLVLVTSLAVPALAFFLAQRDTSGADPGPVAKVLTGIFTYLDVHAGGIVNFTMSIIGVVAFIVLIQQLRDIQNSIPSFTDMIARITKLQRECSHENPLLVISYTPAIGLLALPTPYHDRIFGMMTKRDDDGHPHIRMIVLKEDQLEKWHAEFCGRVTRLGKVSQAAVEKAQSQSMRIRQTLVASGQDRMYGEVDRDSLPGYYCFFNERRAIVVTPFFLPIAGQEESARAQLPPPNMVGYETSDRTTIDYLRQQFGYLESFADWKS